MNRIIYNNISPVIDDRATLMPGVFVIGDVNIAEGVNIWYNSVIRGDINSVHIGARTNIQDNCTVHVDHDYPVVIGSEVTIGHGATIHGCTIADHALIGMGATLLNGCSIGEGAIVAAGSLVKEKYAVPPHSMVAGVPARVVRPVTDEELQSIIESAHHYVETAKKHKLK